MSRLDAFVAAAKQRVADGYYHTEGDPVSNSDFMEALQGPLAVVAEIKPRSPSEGVLLREPVQRVLAELTAGGAAAFSILTDSDFFDGSIENMRLAAHSGRPVLMKDFIVDERQIDCAAHHGASAVLLIERILEPRRREQLVDHAHRRGLYVLLEIHDANDWATAKSSAADVIGVNSRDLDSLELDPMRQIQVIRRVVAAGRVTMALSGVGNRIDRRQAQEAGAVAVLIGSALMRHRDRRLAVRGIRRSLVKICGITSEDDVATAAATGADLVGFIVHAPKSPRQIHLQKAARLAMRARDLGVTPVMVTPDPDVEAVIRAAEAVRPAYVQWHGYDPGIRARLHELGVGLLVAVGPQDEVPEDVDGLVLDSSSSGGTGATHDWDLARITCERRRDTLTFIAGGLDADNVRDALVATGAWGCDASSRLEREPGVKDVNKMTAFIASARL